MKKNHSIIIIEVAIHHETEAAYLLENLNDEKVWVPKSMCEYEDGELQLPEWIAIEKGLI